jgi:hypothetical protein
MNKNQLIANLEKPFHCLLNAKNGNPSKIKGKWITEEHSKEEILKVLDRWEISITKKLTNEIGQQKYKQDVRTKEIFKKHSPENLRDYLTLREKQIFNETKADFFALKAVHEKSQKKLGKNEAVPSKAKSVSSPERVNEKSQRQKKKIPSQPVVSNHYQSHKANGFKWDQPHTAREYIDVCGRGEKKVRKFLKKLREEDREKYIEHPEEKTARPLLYSAEASQRVRSDLFSRTTQMPSWARPHTAEELIEACGGGKTKEHVRKFLKKLREEDPGKYIKKPSKDVTAPVLYTRAASLRVLTELLRSWNKWTHKRHHFKKVKDTDRMAYVEEIIYLMDDVHTSRRGKTGIRKAISEGLDLPWHLIKKSFFS